MQIVMIGTGNVAHVLGAKLVAAGHMMLQVYGRNQQQAEVLAGKLEAEPIDDFAHLVKAADVYIIAVSDSAIPTIAAAMPRVQGVVVHTAGSVSIQVLQGVSEKYGVLYPLQSLRKEKADYDEIPVLVDGNTEDTFSTIKVVAQSISNRVIPANDNYRLKLHLAAVVVSNFTNHLYALAEAFCRKDHTDFTLLQPLIEETAERMQQFAPAHMQTGPAIRGDEATIYRHLQLLESHPHLQRVYRQLTESIQIVNNEQ